MKWLFPALLIFLACSSIQLKSQRAPYSQETLKIIDSIQLIIGEPASREYEELGLIQHDFNPFSGVEYRRFILREQAYMKFGKRVNAIIRMTETWTDESYNRISGMAIKYI